MGKRILILGGSGLIGHKLFERLSERFGTVFATLHRARECFSETGLFENDRVIDNVDVHDFDQLRGIMHSVRPDVVLNCVGITKRRPEVKVPLEAITVNALLPHRLADWGLKNDARVIHFSTDCVFDGTTGDYDEQSHTTATDEYGQTKALGEIRYDHSLTIRSSFVGRELDVFSELLEWFLQQNGKTIKGFTNALYTGVSTIVMSQVVGDIIESHPEISGLQQLSSPEAISKFDLLCLARDAFKMDVEIVPESDFVCKASLDGTLLRNRMKLEVPTWQEMLAELAAETMYDKIKR